MQHIGWNVKENVAPRRGRLKAEPRALDSTGEMRRNVLCPFSATEMKDWQFCQGPDVMHPDRSAELKAAGREAKRVLRESAPGKRRKEVEATHYGPFPCAVWDGEQCAILSIAQTLKELAQGRL